ncbi:MAG TPA: hypothetical protein V6C97_24750 [Oculatellaceae cyanobacterium]
MGEIVRNVDMMRDVQNSTAPLRDMLEHNDLQGAASKLRADMQTMDRDSFMIELGQVQRCTADTPTHIVMKPITDEIGNLRGKDITLASTGVDVNQNPVDCNIPIGRTYDGQATPCAEPIAVRPNCAFEMVARPDDGWIHRPGGVVVFGGRFPDGRVHLALGAVDVNLGIGPLVQRPRVMPQPICREPIYREEVIVNRPPVLDRHWHP